jgi:probable metal-binding protein
MSDRFPMSNVSFSAEVHGHEVIAMMLASSVGYTHESLAAAIRSKFGPNTRFYTCSASNLTAEELIRFLEERGKFTPRDGGFGIDPSQVCQH